MEESKMELYPDHQGNRQKAEGWTEHRSKPIRLYRPHPGDWYGETKQYLYRVRDGWRRVEMLRRGCNREDGDILSGADELHKKLAKAERDMGIVTAAVMNLLGVLSDDQQRTVMVKRYIDGGTWEQISKSMGIPEEEVISLHQTALPVLKRALNRRTDEKV